MKNFLWFVVLGLYLRFSHLHILLFWATWKKIRIVYIINSLFMKEEKTLENKNKTILFFSTWEEEVTY